MRHLSRSLSLFSALPLITSFNWNSLFSKANNNIQRSITSDMSSITASNIPDWDVLRDKVLTTPTGQFLFEQEQLRAVGEGLPHTDAKLRLFGTTAEPRVTLYRDTAAWCPYCQKVYS